MKLKKPLEHFLKHGSIFWLGSEKSCQTEDGDYPNGKRVSLPARTLFIAVGDHYNCYWWNGDVVHLESEFSRKGRVITHEGIMCWIRYNTNDVSVIL